MIVRLSDAYSCFSLVRADNWSHNRRSAYWCLILLSVLCSPCRAFTIEGSRSSYVRFPKWHHAWENRITFEFKSPQINALLLYTDDGGESNFYEISIYDEKIRLRFKIGQLDHQLPVQIMEINKTVSNNQWHSVQLFQFYEKTVLEVDQERVTRILRQNNFLFGDYEKRSDVFIGGIPEEIPHAELSSPTTKEMRHFAGSIQNLVYRTIPQGVTAPHLIDSVGMRETEDDYCTNRNVCKNNGICYSTNSGAKCDCTETDFSGEKCEYEEPAIEASFFGSEYLSVDFTDTKNGINTREEQITMYFKTRRPDGMLFYAGDQQDYIHLALQDGAAVATSNVGRGPVEVKVIPFTSGGSGLRFNDNKWHALTLHRKLSVQSKKVSSVHLSLSVDGVFSEAKQEVGNYEWMSSVMAFIAGKPGNTILAQGLETSNFIGCLTKVRYKSESFIDFLDQVQRGTQVSFVRPHGNLSFNCRDTSSQLEAVSFLSSESFMRLPSWETGDSGSLSFKFRTNEPDGLILFNSAPGANLSSDYVAFELIDGRLHFSLNLGSGHMRVIAGTPKLNDGERWHYVTLMRKQNSGSLMVDNVTEPFNTPGTAKRLDLGGTLYLGALPWESTKFQTTVPSTVWSASLRQGYLGCIKDLSFNGIAIDLLEFLTQKNTDKVEVGCLYTVPQCPENPCKNSGVCKEGFMRYLCDCSMTSMAGYSCDEEPVELRFEKDEQMLRVDLPDTLQSQAEDIQVKFHARRPSGALIATSTKHGFDRMELSLVAGRLEFQLNLGDGAHSFSFGELLSDNRWHTVKIKRRGPKIQLVVDNETPITHELPTSMNAALPVFQYDSFWAGKSPNTSPNPNANPASLLETKLPRSLGFLGSMSSFVFNKIDIFAMAAKEKSGELIYSKGIDVSAKIGPHKLLKDNPVTLKSRSSFAVLPESLLSNSALLHVFFQFRTLESNGLILYSGGESRDFFAVELHQGKIRYTFNSGSGVQTLQSNSGKSLNDFQWHFVLIMQNLPEEHWLIVNNATTKFKVLGENKQINLRGDLFVGGVDRNKYSSLADKVQSKHGYRGCLASLEISYTQIDLLNANLRQEGVQKGCQGPSVMCDSESCSHGGVCLQRWTNVQCDCSLTTFAGSKCEDQSSSFKFGPDPGLILYDFPVGKYQSTQSDTFSVGIQTHQENAVVFRVETDQPDDVLMLELNNGHAVIAYHLGTEEHRITDLFNRVDDGKYHIIRFTRNEQNSTFQLDNHALQIKTPIGPQLDILNGQNQIQIGGRYLSNFEVATDGERKRRFRRQNPRSRIQNPFVGTLSGLNFNGMRLLDMTIEGHSRIQVIGDVTVVNDATDKQAGPSKNDVVDENSGSEVNKDITNRMMSSSSSLVPQDGSNDELIYSGDREGGSGCSQSDERTDEEDCEIEDPSPTDLITPHWRDATTRAPPPTQRTFTEFVIPKGPIKEYPESELEVYEENPDDFYESGDGEDFYEYPEIFEILPTEKTTVKVETTTKKTTTTTTTTTPTTTTTESTTTEDTAEVIWGPPLLAVTTTEGPTTEETYHEGEPVVFPPSEKPEKIHPAPRPEINLTPPPAKEKEAEPFPRTGLISAVSIIVIVLIIVIVFIVFKCYNRTKSPDTYSMEDSGAKQYALYAGAPPGSQGCIVANTQRVAPQPQSNGFSKTGKKKGDFKEWYV